MGKQIDRIKQRQELAPNEILAGLIWDRAVNSRDRIFKVPYYQFPCYIEYCHEHEDDGFSIDVLYLGQESSFMLIQPDYKSVLGVAGGILEWLEETYRQFCPPEPPKPERKRRRSSIRPAPSLLGISQSQSTSQQKRAQSATKMGPGNTPRKAPQNGPKQTS